MISEKEARKTPRSFTRDLENGCFRLDGATFVPMAGEMHYFRVIPDQWEDRLKKLKSAHLNCVTTAIEWSMHEPLPGLYDFDNELDIKRFLTTANEQELLVILKIGPQIYAHTDFGGLPYWLLTVNPKIRCRVQDESFLYFFGRWLKRLYSTIQPFLVGNGGPIIMIQIEDAYGSFPVHDSNYLYWLRDINRYYVGDKALLFTSDFPDQVCINRGFIHGVFATLKFGCSSSPVKQHFEALKILQPQGPLMNSQFWIGRPTTSQDEDLQKIEFEAFREELADLIAEGIGFNLHMFVGGTNFGLAGGVTEESAPCLTSYDCDAAISETGDLTVKYALIQAFISEISSEYAALDEDEKYDILVRMIEDVKTPEIEGKGSYGRVKMSMVDTILNTQMTCCLKSCVSPFLKTLEEMCVKEGLIAYTTTLEKDFAANAIVSATVKDRAYVILDMTELIGILDQTNPPNGIVISKTLPKGTKLSFLMETMGRLPFKPGRSVSKGLFNVRLNDEYLHNWIITTYSIKGQKSIERLHKTMEEKLRQMNPRNQQESLTLQPPAFYFGTFTIPKGDEELTGNDEVPEKELEHIDDKEGQTSHQEVGDEDEVTHGVASRNEVDEVEKLDTDSRSKQKAGKESDEKANGELNNEEQDVATKSKEDHKETWYKVHSNGNTDRLEDTFLNLTGWTKGIVYINKWCVGRYWTIGPVLTLYVPGSYLLRNPKKNTITILELEKAPENPWVELVKNHVMVDRTKVDTVDKNENWTENLEENEVGVWIEDGAEAGQNKEDSSEPTGEKKELSRVQLEENQNSIAADAIEERVNEEHSA